ncbi:MAG TPA: DUF2127 domain-containing protein [Nitrospiria bacterium]|jgi:uncharacterized membrane protein (DUF2068 family)
MKGRSADFILKLIILDRFIVGTLLILLSMGLFNLIGRDLATLVRGFVEALNLDVDNHYIQLSLTYLSLVNNKIVFGISLGIFLYGVLYLIQGYGLHLRKRWAEYLTVVAVGLLIPFEIFEVLQKLTLFRVSALVINIAIVVFLIRHKELFPKKEKPHLKRAQEPVLPR